MSGVILDVDPNDFVVAAEWSREVAVRLSEARGALRRDLGECGAMAGGDPAGQAWAEAYDPVAADAIRGLDALEAAFGKIGAGLAVTGYNYAAADWMSAGNAGEPPGHEVPSIPAPTCSVPPASAEGGTGAPDLPGWAAVAGWVGAVWPDGDTTRLRAVQAGWSAAATGLSALTAGEATRVSTALSESQTPEMPTILSTIESAVTGISELAEGAAGLAHACGQLADEIDEVHRQSRDELLELVAEIGGAFLLGAVLTPITAGVSDAISVAAAGSRVWTAAQRILSFIARLAARVASVSSRVTSAAVRVGKIARLSETVSVRVVTISGRVVVNGAAGSATNVVATAITDPDADFRGAAVEGFVGGAAFGEGSHAVASSRLGTAVRGTVSEKVDVAILRTHIDRWAATRGGSSYNPYGGMRPRDWFMKYYKGPDERGHPDWRWPGHDGFVPGTARPNTLRVGDVIERISPVGYDGAFATTPGASFEKLSLPPDRLAPAFAVTRYEVMKPLGPGILQGPIATHFEQPGGALQYFFPHRMQVLINAGSLKEVP